MYDKIHYKLKKYIHYKKKKEIGSLNRTVINKEIESVIKNIPKRKVQDRMASLDESNE